MKCQPRVLDRSCHESGTHLQLFWLMHLNCWVFCPPNICARVENTHETWKIDSHHTLDDGASLLNGYLNSYRIGLMSLFAGHFWWELIDLSTYTHHKTKLKMMVSGSMLVFRGGYEKSEFDIRHLPKRGRQWLFGRSPPLRHCCDTDNADWGCGGSPV